MTASVERGEPGEDSPVFCLSCPKSDLDATGAKGLAGEDTASAVVVVKVGHSFRAYVNRCPHTGVPLEWMRDRFLDGSGEYLICATHGALFRKQDGYCVVGPCAGQSLETLDVRERGSRIEVEWSDQSSKTSRMS